MVITIDTSALIAVIGNEGSKQKIIEITKGCSLCAPMSVHWEIGNALSAIFKRRSSNIELAKVLGVKSIYNDIYFIAQASIIYYRLSHIINSIRHTTVMLQFWQLSALMPACRDDSSH